MDYLAGYMSYISFCVTKFQFVVLVPSRVWGRHAPTRSCPKGAENFQELKICGHGTILALTLSLSLRFSFLKVYRSFVIIKLKEGGYYDFAIFCHSIRYGQ